MAIFSLQQQNWVWPAMIKISLYRKTLLTHDSVWPLWVQKLWCEHGVNQDNKHVTNMYTPSCQCGPATRRALKLIHRTFIRKKKSEPSLIHHWVSTVSWSILLFISSLPNPWSFLKQNQNSVTFWEFFSVTAERGATLSSTGKIKARGCRQPFVVTTWKTSSDFSSRTKSSLYNNLQTPTWPGHCMSLTSSNMLSKYPFRFDCTDVHWTY